MDSIYKSCNNSIISQDFINDQLSLIQFEECFDPLEDFQIQNSKAFKSIFDEENDGVYYRPELNFGDIMISEQMSQIKEWHNPSDSTSNENLVDQRRSFFKNRLEEEKNDEMSNRFKIDKKQINKIKHHPDADQLLNILCKIWQDQTVSMVDIQNLGKEYKLCLKIFLQKKFKKNFVDFTNQIQDENYMLDLCSKPSKRHEEQYKFISKRFLKFLKKNKKLKCSFLYENFKKYFDKQFDDMKFTDYFKYDNRKSQFILRKSNRFFFQIVFEHPIFKDHFLQFRQNFFDKYKIEVAEKFSKIISNMMINENHKQQIEIETQLQNIKVQKSLKLPWTFCETQQAFKFIDKSLQINKFYKF